MVLSTEGRVLKKANPKTIQNKFLVGYQGWFTCAGDGPPVHNGHHGWLHWFNVPIPDGGRPNTDVWPDVSSYSPSELFPAPGLTMADGSPALLFSSRHPKTVRRHFHWMAEHGVDGAFLQRFAGQCEVDGRTDSGNADLMRLRDEVGRRVRESAEAEGRVFAIMYDVSGVPADRIERVIKVDWAHLVHDEGVLDSPNYLRENGMPVIALWGFGFAGRNHSPDIVRNIVRHIRASTPGGAYIMAGAPTHWQTLRGDADPNPEFLHVWYNEFDAISPWTVGRYHNEETVDRFAREKVQKDIEALNANTGGRKVDYIPVVFPGGSGYNLSQGKWGLNEMARDGGRFLWRQLYNVKKAGVNIVYGAMWDEYDEGTAFLPIVSKKRELPRPGDHFLALDADGYDLPPDWYMRICGFAGEILRGERPVHETFPVKDLQDYWSSRPRYEPAPIEPEAVSVGPSGSGSGDVTQSYEAWCEREKEGIEDLPPPPYSLEAMNAEAAGPSLGSTAQQQTPSQQPPVHVQTRPASLPAQASSSSGTNIRPNSVERPQVPSASRPAPSGLATWSPGPGIQEQGAAQYLPPLAHRPTSLPSSSSSSSSSAYQIQYRPSASSIGRHSSGPAPGEIFNHPQPPFSPSHSQISPPLTPNWNTRPQQQQQYLYNDPARMQGSGTLSPRPPNNIRPSVSISNLNDRFGQQSLNEPQDNGLRNPHSPQNPNLRPTSQQSSHPNSNTQSYNLPPRPATAGQWPPPEWGTQPPQAPPRPPTLPPPQHPQHPSSRPPASPFQGRYGPSPSPMVSTSSYGSSSSTSSFPSPNPANHAPLPSPGWDSDYGRGDIFPQPATDPAGSYQSQVPYAPYVSSMRRHHSGSSPPLSEPSGYNSIYPDSTQNYPMPMPGRSDYGSEAGAPGGFYAGPQQHSHYPGSPGPGSGYPPQIPSRPPGMTPSVKPGQIMPSANAAPAGGMIPGRLGNVASNAYSYTLGAVDKLASGGARKRVEGSIDTLSSAGSKVYQRFRN